MNNLNDNLLGAKVHWPESSPEVFTVVSVYVDADLFLVIQCDLTGSLREVPVNTVTVISSPVC